MNHPTPLVATKTAPSCRDSFFENLGVFSSEEHDRLLPKKAFSPWMLILFGAIPQLILFLVNLSSYSMVAKDLSPEQQWNWAVLGLGSLGMAALYCAVTWYLKRQGKLVGVVECLLGFIPPVAFLVIVFGAVAMFGASVSLLPEGAERWLLTEDVFFTTQLTFVMPGILLPVVLLAGWPSGGWPVGIGEVERKKSTEFKFGLAILAVAGLCLLGFWLMLTTSIGFLGAIPMMLMVAGIGIMIGIGLIKLVLASIRSAARSGHNTQIVLATLLCLVFPLAGLMVNLSIPFPGSFRGIGIWVLACVNAMFLLVPPLKGRGELFPWLARIALLVFPLYFTAVYLPFLPFAVPALFVWGAGLLMLAPILLLLFQASRIVAGWHQLRAHSGFSKASLAVYAVLAFTALPAAFVARCVHDRSVLRTGLDHAFVGNTGLDSETGEFTTEDVVFNGSLSSMRRALTNLYRVKHGDWLPYTTAAYNRIVFDGLVLPDEKIQHMHRAFFGEELEINSKRGMFSSGWGFGSRGQGRTRGIDNPLPQDSVEMVSIESTRQVDADGIAETLATINVRNLAGTLGEFTTDMVVPAGSLITGFWLDIEGEWVQGKIFEQKAALWVYQMIRDTTRCDPSVLWYRQTGELNLRIYPVPGNGTRRVRVAFSTPDDSSAEALIGDRTLALTSRGKAANNVSEVGGSEPDSSFIAGSGDGTGATLVLSKHGCGELPTVVRTPYLHLIVDRSAGSQDWTQAEVREVVAALQRQIPEVTTARVSFANYQISSQTDDQDLIEIDALPRAISDDHGLVTAGGGFVRDEAIRHALAAGVARTKTDPNSYPIIAILRNTATESITESDDGFRSVVKLAAHLPDSEVFYTWTSGSLEASNFWRIPVSLAKAAKRDGIPVTVVRASGATTRPVAFAANSSEPNEMKLLHLFDPKTTEHFEALNEERWEGLPIPLTRLPETATYAKGLRAMRVRAREDIRIGGGTGATQEVLDAARHAGTLVPGSTYLVMDMSWQWTAVEKAERKKLGGHKAMEMSETPDEVMPNGAVPEPSSAMLLLLAMVAGLCQRRRSRAIGC